MQLYEDRRALHRIPELDRNLPETMAYLKNALKDLNCEVFSPVPGTPLPSAAMRMRCP